MLALIVFAALLILGGAIALAFEARRWRAVNRWPTVDGRVIQLRVAVYSSPDGTGYIPRIEYEYSVAGATYRHDQGLSTFGLVSYSQAQKQIDLRQSERFLPVAYNPNNPARSYLADAQQRYLRPGPVVFFFATFPLGVFLLLLAPTL